MLSALSVMIAVTLSAGEPEEPPTERFRFRVSLLPELQLAYRIHPNLWLGARAYGVNVYLHFLEGQWVSRGAHIAGGVDLSFSPAGLASDEGGVELTGGMVVEFGDYGPLATPLPMPARGTLVAGHISVVAYYRWFGGGLHLLAGRFIPEGSSTPQNFSVGMTPSVFVQHSF